MSPAQHVHSRQHNQYNGPHTTEIVLSATEVKCFFKKKEVIGIIESRNDAASETDEGVIELCSPTHIHFSAFLLLDSLNVSDCAFGNRRLFKNYSIKIMECNVICVFHDCCFCMKN